MNCPQPDYLIPKGEFYVIGTLSSHVIDDYGPGHGKVGYHEATALLESGRIYSNYNDLVKRMKFDQKLAAPYIKPIWFRHIEEEAKTSGRKLQQRSSHTGEWYYELIESDWTKESPENFRLEPLPKRVRHVIAGMGYSYPEPLKTREPVCYRILALDGQFSIEKVDGRATADDSLLQATRKGAEQQLEAMRAFLGVKPQ